MQYVLHGDVGWIAIPPSGVIISYIMHSLKCELYCAALFIYAKYVCIACKLKIRLETQSKTADVKHQRERTLIGKKHK